MCGIVGYVGEKNCYPILLNGLKNLEYRGYDSAGIAFFDYDNIKVIKEKGKVKNLENILNNNNNSNINILNNNCIGIAHTRWATHGKPSKINSHPHLDNYHNFAVVHNGIIENYKELRDFLEKNNYTFFSDTDTEVIPNLIDYYYKQLKDTSIKGFQKAVSLACKDLKGSFAILVLSSFFKNTIIAAKKDSPLVIGKANKEYYIASDIPAILEYTKDFYFLDDNEISSIDKDSISFYDIDLNKVNKNIKSVEWDSLDSTKRGYDNFMLKEIFEQKDSILKTIKDRIHLDKICDFSDINLTKEDILSIDKIYIVACGTAMNAGLVAKNAIEKLCRIPTIVEIASEFRYKDPLITKNTLCIFISQSGETADTIAALKLAKQNKAKTLAISNVYGSSITREADSTIYTKAGPEIAVASTKAYTSQVSLILLFAIYLAEVLEICDKLFLKTLKIELLILPNKIEIILKNHHLIEDIASNLYLSKDIYFIGRGIDYLSCIEASLKLKEISYIHSESYTAGELKHGPIALIENNVPVISILTDSNLKEKTLSNIEEVITRGAKVFVISDDENLKNSFDYSFIIPPTNNLFSPILSIIPMQLLSYYITKLKGLDVDKPRNLAKSVTVE